MTKTTDTGIIPTLLESSNDPQSKQAPAEGGLRGERVGDAESEGYPRSVGGIAVLDTSGTAHAEAGIAPHAVPRRPRAAMAPTPSALAWLVVAGGSIGFLAGLNTRRRPVAALPVQRPRVRDAGPANMIDREPRPWTVIDEASDQSFPASDPPSTY